MFDVLMLLGFYLLIGLAVLTRVAEEGDTPGTTFILVVAWPLLIGSGLMIECLDGLIILADSLVEWAYGEREE